MLFCTFAQKVSNICLFHLLKWKDFVFLCQLWYQNEESLGFSMLVGYKSRRSILIPFISMRQTKIKCYFKRFKRPVFFDPRAHQFDQWQRRGPRRKEVGSLSCLSSHSGIKGCFEKVRDGHPFIPSHSKKLQLKENRGVIWHLSVIQTARLWNRRRKQKMPLYRPWKKTLTRFWEIEHAKCPDSPFEVLWMRHETKKSTHFSSEAVRLRFVVLRSSAVWGT